VAGRPAALALDAQGLSAAPSSGVEAEVWRQVLAWLRIPGDEIAWRAGGGAIELPAAQAWSTPEGKRALWNALKAHARRSR